MTNSPFSHRQPRVWLKVSIETTKTASEGIAAHLSQLTGAGIEIRPAPAADNECLIGYLELPQENSPVEQQLESFQGMMQKLFPGAWFSLTTEKIQEEDWGETWKEHFKPFHITPRIVIKPSWESYPAADDELIIEMDPGMAFGTGHHASTSLILQFIEKYFASPRFSSVLDVGTGTGILAIACALLGSKQVLAVDNDPDAVAAARMNVATNNLETAITVTESDLRNCGQFDLIVANITSETLIALAPVLKQHLAADGMIMLSGILAGSQEEKVESVYDQLDMQTAEKAYKEEWVSLVMNRKKND